MRDFTSGEIERASRWSAIGAIALAALAAVWFGVRLLWVVLGRGGDTTLMTPAVPVGNVAAPAATVSIAKWHLFGQSATNLAAGARSAPVTQLRLSLHGTLAEADPKQGIALIGDETGAELAYRVGDALPGGATLSGIYPDRVVLDHEGAEETLALPFDQSSVSVTPLATGATSATSGSRGIANANNPSAVPPGVNVLFTPPHVASGSVDLGKIQQQIQLDPAILARQFNAQPVFVSGRMTGVRLSGGPDAALIAKLGLKPDDVITSVNGITLDSPARVPQLIESLKNASRVEATVQRDGKPTTLSVNIKQ